jgi:hypothetical protein
LVTSIIANHFNITHSFKEQEEKEVERRAQIEREQQEREQQREKDEERLRQRLQREKEAEENRRRREMERVASPPVTTTARVEPERTRAPALDWAAARSRKLEPSAVAEPASTGTGRYVPPARKFGAENTPPQTAKVEDKPAAGKYEPPKGKFIPSAATAAYRPPSAGRFGVGNGVTAPSSNGKTAPPTSWRRSGPTTADGKPATPDDSDNNGSDEWTTVKRK